MTTVIVTGAAGFVGRSLTAHLAGRGVRAVAVSRRVAPGFHQVRDYGEIPEGDVVVHLAEESDRAKVNRLGEAYAHQAADVVKALCRRFGGGTIYASSGAVYGDQHDGPCGVDMPVAATDVYSRLKLANERIVLDAGGTAVRLSNLFGDGMAANNVLSDIIRQLPREEPLRIRDGGPVRDFLSVTDAASALGLIAASNRRGITNVGSGTGISVKALARLLLKLAGQESREIVETRPSSARSVNVLDISATAKAYGWKPAAALEDELARLLRAKANLVS